MKVFVSMGPIIGVIMIALYMLYLRLFYYMKSLKVPNGQQRITYDSGLRINLFADIVGRRDRIIFHVLLAVEALLILISLVVPRVTDGDYLMDGMAARAKCVITDNTFKVSYAQAKREYSNRISFAQEELDRLSVKCSAEQGNVFLTIRQDKAEKKVDITNTNSLLDMTDFAEGAISFVLTNEDARDVDFELIW